MSTLARIIIATIVGPGLGAVVGQDAARMMAYRLGLETGAVVRWEMSGLLVGLLIGAIYLLLSVRCVIGFKGRLRSRIADPALLPAGGLAAIGLLAGQCHAAADVLAVVRGTTTAVWLLGFLLLLTSLRYRPPVPVPDGFPGVGPEFGEGEQHDAVDEETWRRYVSEEISNE